MTEEDLERIIPEIKDYLITHGSLLKLVRYEELSTVQARPVGVSIVPTRFPRAAFEQAQKLQPCMNELYIRAASDEPWLEEVFQPLLKQDVFLSSLWDVWLKVKAAGVVQDVVCGIFRSDYMLHTSSAQSSPALKQVEMNTFSVAGAFHAQTAARMHKHISRVQNDTTKTLPSNDNISSIVSMLSQVHNLYKPTTSHHLCILMIVQPENFNIADERPIEYSLWENKNIPCYRCEWHKVLSQTTLTPDRTLLFRNTFEVTTIYYRAGYEPSEYIDNERNPRLHLELSRAIKCPDILTHLTTFKSVQAALTQPGTLDLFLPSTSTHSIRKTFMPMQPPNPSTPPPNYENHILKPNLEGGGTHNIFGPSIPSFLSTLKSPSEFKNYTLMQLIHSPPTFGYLMSPPPPPHHEIYSGEVISELGILGTWIFRGKGRREILRNDVAGWTFKTKPVDVKEMSVVKGFGAFDCPDFSTE